MSVRRKGYLAERVMRTVADLLKETSFEEIDYIDREENTLFCHVRINIPEFDIPAMKKYVIWAQFRYDLEKRQIDRIVIINAPSFYE